jgi:methyl-accepting chemotaxis protein
MLGFGLAGAAMATAAIMVLFSYLSLNSAMKNAEIQTRNSSTGGEIARRMDESAREVGQNAAATQQLSATVQEIGRTASRLNRVSENMALAVARFQV